MHRVLGLSSLVHRVVVGTHDALDLFQIDTHLVVRFECDHVRS